jgi:phosphinothricin acetyltransferase
VPYDELMGSEISIRAACEADAAAIQAIYAPIVRDTAISFEEDPPSVEEMASRIQKTLIDYPFLVCDRDGEIVGYAYAGQHRVRAAYRWSVDVSVYVSPKVRRGGIGRALYTALLTILNGQGFHTAFAGIALPNEASIGLHEAVGFEPLGVYREVGFKHGRWHDVGWWRRSLGRNERPSEPVPFMANLEQFIAAKLLTS